MESARFRRPLLAAMALGLAASSAAAQNCEIASYGEGVNPGTLDGFGIATIGSTLFFSMTDPQVPSAFGFLAYSLRDDSFPALGGTLLISPLSAHLIGVTSGKNFTGLASAVTEQITVPNDVVLNDLQVFFQGLYVDPLSGPEPNRLTNGVRVTLCALLPDLVVSEADAIDPLGFQGTAIQVRDVVQNQGTFQSQPFNVGIYLSTDATVTTGDLFLDQRPQSGLFVDGGTQAYGTYQIAQDFPPGTYYVGVVADHDGGLQELVETNNLLVANGMVTIEGPPVGLSYADNPASYPLGALAGPNLPSSTGTVSFYTVAPALPLGLSLDTFSGAILGIPVELSPATVYTVTAHNPAGTSSVQLSLEVVP